MNPANDKEKILIVDDTPATLSMLREGLEDAGYKVYVATSGEKAQTRARQLMPDLILLDVLMPGLDGFQTCCQLKADKTIREIPVIFMTALDDAEKKVRGFKTGAVDYVTKPIELEEVLARIETHLSLRRFSRELESLVEARTAELKQSREDFCAVANYTYDWESWVDSEGKTKWINPAVKRITGYSVDECMTMENYPLSLIHEEDCDLVTDIMKEALDGSSGNDKPFRIIEKNGATRWVAMSWQSIYDTKGKSLGYRASVRDITERKQAEQKVEQLNQELEDRVIQRTAQLEAANKELEAFAYSVSHDLRAPLRGIDGFSQMLVEQYHDKVDDKGQNYLQRILQSTQRMGQLIDDMLMLSRISRSEMKIQQVDLSDIARKIALELCETHPDRQVEFVIHDGVQARGDKRLLRIVMTNLFQNAWKFTSKHPAPRIEFDVQHQHETPVYVVSDNGAGFDMKYAEKLFGVFQRLHSESEFSGTGIGLATVQRIIHRHGGTVWAEGQVDKGATVYFTI